MTQKPELGELLRWWRDICGQVGTAPGGKLTIPSELIKQTNAALNSPEPPAEAISHDWMCGCGHWNGANLYECAVCRRKPGEVE